MIQIRVNPAAVLSSLDMASRQAPFAVALALNRLAKDAQTIMRGKLRENFQLRRVAWNERGIKIKDWASKTSASVTIYVDEKVNYFNKFEEGGDKVPVAGSHYIWEPNQDFFKRRVIGTDFRPKGLGMHKDSHGRVIGNKDTFLVKTSNSEMPYLVVQRFHRLSKGSTRMLSRMTLDSFAGGQGPRQKREKHSLTREAGTVVLYKLKKRVHVDAQLGFVSTIRDAVHYLYRGHMMAAWAEAVRPKS